MNDTQTEQYGDINTVTMYASENTGYCDHGDCFCYSGSALVSEVRGK